MFVDNKYTKTYYSIISNAQVAARSKQHGYFEKHHIIPRSLNGNNDTTNLVLLTAREHFICHALLIKMVPKGSLAHNKLTHALIAMGQVSNNQNRYFNSRLYNIARKEIGSVMSQLQSGKLNSQFGTTWVSHLVFERTIKVQKSSLPEYLAQGYVAGRIVNFTKHKADLERKVSKLNSQIQLAQLHLDSLIEQKNNLLANR